MSKPTTTTSIIDIPDGLLILVLRHTSRRRRFPRHFQVCRKWAEAIPEIASKVVLKGNARLDPPRLAQILQNYHCLERLHFRKFSIAALNDEVLHVISATCPRLLSLKFKEDCCSPSALTVTEAGMDALFKECQELRHVFLRGHHIDPLVLPESLGLLKKLKTLEVRLLNPESVSKEHTPQTASNLGFLTTVKIASSTPFFPPSLGHLRRLQTLVVECENITELPDVGELSRLEEVRLRCDNLGLLPDSFCALRKLRVLYTYSSMLLELPDLFGDLTSLARLDLWTPKLVSLPSSFGDLPRLRVLKLMNCRNLRELPLSFGKLPQLADLSISLCALLDSLPEGFGELPSLTKIFINMCDRMQQLSSDFGHLPKLKYLHLRGLTPIDALPATFGQLPCLESLHITGCLHLADLSAGFGDLPALRRLDLESLPALQRLPPSFRNLSSIANLNITSGGLVGEVQESMEGWFPRCYRWWYKTHAVA